MSKISSNQPKPSDSCENELSDCTNILSKSGVIPETENVNSRKRKRDDDYNSLAELLKLHTDRTDSKLESLQASLSEIIGQNAEIKKNC